MLVFPILKDIDVAYFTDLFRSRGSTLNIESDKVFCAQGEGTNRLFFVDKGLIKNSLISEDGDEKLIGIYGPGTVFGEYCLITGLPQTVNLITMEETTLYFLNKDVFFQLIQDDPVFCLEIMKRMAEKICVLVKRIESITFLNPHNRLLMLLQALVVKRNDNDEWVEIDLRLSHQQMADILGLNRVTISKMMHDFREQSIIKNTRQKVWINNKYLDNKTGFWF